MKPCPFCGEEMLQKFYPDGEVEFYHNMDCIFPEIRTLTPQDFIEKWDQRKA